MRLYEMLVIIGLIIIPVIILFLITLNNDVVYELYYVLGFVLVVVLLFWIWGNKK